MLHRTRKRACMNARETYFIYEIKETNFVA
jgi:hypothetical protein